MYVTCLEQQSFCHALRKNLKFKLLYFQNKECYPAENKQAHGNLYFLLCDEDKNPKLCLVMNFSFLWRHVKTKIHIITITHHDRHKGETGWANKQIFIDVVRLRKRDPWVGWAGSFLTLLTRDCWQADKPHAIYYNADDRWQGYHSNYCIWSKYQNPQLPPDSLG